MSSGALRVLLKAAFAASCVGGCAINGSGTALVDFYENDHGYFIRTRVLGLHVVTVPSDEGITIGFSDRSYFHPKLKATGSNTFAQLGDSPLSQSMRKTLPSETAQQEKSEPVASVVRTIGLAIRASTTGAGITLGLNTHARFWVPRDWNGVQSVSFDSERLEATEFFYSEEGP